MTAVVLDMRDYIGWRPVKRTCFWCGHTRVRVAPKGDRELAECDECGLFAMAITHELADDGRDWVPV